MGSLETLLTRLEISSQGELVAGFRDLGEINFPNWLNSFCARLGRKWEKKSYLLLKELQGQLALFPETAEAARNPNTSRVISKDWVVYQVDLPVSAKQHLPKIFSRGNYTKQARFLLKSPWNYVPLPIALREGLLAKKQVEGRLNQLREDLFKIYGQNRSSRIFNALRETSNIYRGDNASQVVAALEEKKVGTLPEEIVSRRLAIQKRILEVNLALSGEAQIAAHQKELRLEAEDWSFLSTGRMVSANEIFSGPLLFLDIEIPEFRTSNPLISWIGSAFLENGNAKYTIDTIHDLQRDSVRDFEVHSHKNEASQIDAFKRRIIALDPLAVSAHNARFDLIKLRESTAGFDVGEEETPPLFKVTTPFFERIGIKDRLVLDTMRWYKIAHAYDFNAKLEMVTGVEKTISYDEMQRLERGTIEDKQKIAEYLTDDIRGPVKAVLLSEGFRKNLEDVLFIADTFNVSPERLLHSSKCINEAQERLFFSELGVHREQIPPNQKTTRMQEKRRKARESFTNSITRKGVKFEEQEGLFSDVYKAYIPIGNILREVISHRFPDAERLFEYRDKHRGDKQRLFFIEQYTKSLSEWFVESYGEFLGEAIKLRDLTERAQITEEEVKNVYESLKESLRSFDPKQKRVLSEGRLSLSALERGLDELSRELVVNKGVAIPSLLDILNTYSKKGRVERRLIGNFDVFPSRTSLNKTGAVKEKPLFINEILRAAFQEINAFISTNNLKVISQEGNYLYLTGGDKSALRREDCPLVLVDEIPKLYQAKNPYYQKNGFCSHLRVSDDPSFNLSVFEMDRIKRMIDSLLEGKVDQAKNIYAQAIRELETGAISASELVFYNKSRQRYFIYSLLPQRERMYFVESEKQVPADSQIAEEASRKYFRDTETGQPVYIMKREEAVNYIDQKKYFQRFVDRGREILKPVSSKTKKANFRPGQLSLDGI